MHHVVVGMNKGRRWVHTGVQKLDWCCIQTLNVIVESQVLASVLCEQFEGIVVCKIFKLHKYT